MKHSRIAKHLGRALIVAAWADGQIQPAEVDCLKDLLFLLPALDTAEWLELESALLHPPAENEALGILEELKSNIQNEEDLGFALYALDRVVQADGVVTKEEQARVEHIKTYLTKPDAKSIDALKGLLQQPLRRRGRVSRSGLPTRKSVEGLVERSARQLATKVDGASFTPEECRKLALAAILMARVVKCDGSTRSTGVDVRTLAQFLHDKWRVNSVAADFIASLCLQQSTEKLDVIRVSRCFYNCTSRVERIRFLDILFELTLVDGVVTEAEIEEVIEIAANLKLDQAHFQDALARFLKPGRTVAAAAG